MSRIRGQGVVAHGLDDFRRELAKLDDSTIVEELKDVNLSVAQLVVARSQATAAGLGRMQARAASTLKASRQAARAQVTGGGAGAPFFNGAVFGAGQNQPRNTARGQVLGWNQFLKHKGSGEDAGYFVFPDIRDASDEIVDMYGDGMERIASRAFPD